MIECGSVRLIRALLFIFCYIYISSHSDERKWLNEAPFIQSCSNTVCGIHVRTSHKLCMDGCVWMCCSTYATQYFFSSNEQWKVLPMCTRSVDSCGTYDELCDWDDNLGQTFVIISTICSELLLFCVCVRCRLLPAIFNCSQRSTKGMSHYQYRILFFQQNVCSSLDCCYGSSQRAYVLPFPVYSLAIVFGRGSNDW